jgi:hypothetical protein
MTLAPAEIGCGRVRVRPCARRGVEQIPERLSCEHRPCQSKDPDGDADRFEKPAHPCAPPRGLLQASAELQEAELPCDPFHGRTLPDRLRLLVGPDRGRRPPAPDACNSKHMSAAQTVKLQLTKRTLLAF